MPDPATEDETRECPRCGAITIGAECSCALPAEQHEVQRLFTPTRTMPGQTGFTI